MFVRNLIANINIDLQFIKAYQESDTPIILCLYMSITHENNFQMVLC